MKNTTLKDRPDNFIQRLLPWLLIVGGIIGFICAFIIAQDKLQLLANPNYRPSCDLNPVIACGSVMQSQQSNAFGFSNPYIGLAAFPVLATIGVAMLAGAKFKRWYWLGVEAGAVFGLGFINWLFFESVYRIHSLCPYCMVVWGVTITIFIYTTLFNLLEGNIILPKYNQIITAWLRKHHLDLLIFWLLIILALIMNHFWYYYGHHI